MDFTRESILKEIEDNIYCPLHHCANGGDFKGLVKCTAFLVPDLDKTTVAKLFNLYFYEATVLFLAAASGSVECVKFVLKFSCEHLDVNKGEERNFGVTPLMVAIESHSVECRNLILAHPGCNVNALDWRSFDALRFAISLIDLGSVKALVEKGCIISKDNVEYANLVVQAFTKELTKSKYDPDYAKIIKNWDNAKDPLFLTRLFIGSSKTSRAFLSDIHATPL